LSLCLSLTPTPPSTSTLSLHDALPICRLSRGPEVVAAADAQDRLEHDEADQEDHQADEEQRPPGPQGVLVVIPQRLHVHAQDARSEEHTSELQSHLNLVCRLLLEKKKQ